MKNEINFFCLKNKKTHIFFLCLFLLITGCDLNNSKNNFDVCYRVETPCEKSKKNILLITNRGEIEIELNGEMAPVTVGNFIDLVEKGLYDKTYFHRVINKPFPLLILGGEITGENTIISKENKNSISSSIPKGRFIPLEIKLKFENSPRYSKIVNSANNIKKIELRHKKGSLSMARSVSLNSASTQFYISLKSLPELDGRYAVFGKVVRGMNVVDLIRENDFIIKVIKL